MTNLSNKKINSTPLSDFVKETTPGEKERVYERMILAASKSQNAIIEKAKAHQLNS